MTPVMTAADLEDMPQYQKDALCAWVVDMTKAVFSQPGVEEEYQRWLVAYRARIAHKQEEETKYGRNLLPHTRQSCGTGD